ncbi:MAG: hypothetical protein JNL80_16650 [Phycisphaerae bacterium]|nr:hypothetical protein [Phycisphaerae bacterium]
MQPLIRGLLNATLAPSDLTASDRTLVAKWAAKVAWLLNDASNYRKVVPAGAFRHLFNHSDTLPARTLVTLTMAPGPTPIWWIQGALWLASTLADFPAESTKSLAESSLKTGLRFGSINLIVSCWPVDDWQFFVVRGLHDVLWPQERLVGSCVESTPIDADFDPLMSVHALIKIRQAGAEAP